MSEQQNDLFGFEDAMMVTAPAEIIQDQNDFEASMIEPEQPDDDIILPPKPTPEQLDKMLYGLIGDIARTAADGNEVNPISVALNTMVWIGTEITPQKTFALGDQNHGANVWGIHIGRSSRGGKGESMALIKRLKKAVEIKALSIGANELLARTAGSLSSTEGLIDRLHDGYRQNDDEIPPIHDKRLHIVLSEFASLLETQKRQGNTLSATIRDAWDYYPVIGNMTRNNPRTASGLHIGMLGNITPMELLKKLTDSDVYGGLLNRFLLIYAERTHTQPFPNRTPDNLVDSLADRLLRIIMREKQGYGDVFFSQHDAKVMTLSAEAVKHWEAVYEPLRNPYGTTGIVQTLSERSAPYAFRIALLMAIIDGTPNIEKHHLECGIAWVEYSRMSTAYIFGERARQDADPKAEKLIMFLTKQPNHEATRKEITKDCFSGNLPKAIIDGLLRSMIDAHKLDVRQESPKAGGTNVTIYKLKTKNGTNSTNSTNSIENKGLSNTNTVRTVVRTVKTPKAESSQFVQSSSQFVPEFVPQVVENNHSSYSSYSSYELNNSDSPFDRNPSRETEEL